MPKRPFYDFDGLQNGPISIITDFFICRYRTEPELEQSLQISGSVSKWYVSTHWKKMLNNLVFSFQKGLFTIFDALNIYPYEVFLIFNLTYWNLFSISSNPESTGNPELVKIGAGTTIPFEYK